MRFPRLVKALSLAAFGAGITLSPVAAEILSPPTINGAYTVGVTNQGG